MVLSMASGLKIPYSHDIFLAGVIVDCNIYIGGLCQSWTKRSSITFTRHELRLRLASTGISKNLLMDKGVLDRHEGLEAE